MFYNWNYEKVKKFSVLGERKLPFNKRYSFYHTFDSWLNVHPTLIRGLVEALGLMNETSKKSAHPTSHCDQQMCPR